MPSPIRLPALALALFLGAGAPAAQQADGGASPSNPAPFTLARFRPHPAEGDAPLAVRFEDRSLGGVTSWSWDFGDGTSSSQRAPTKVYAEGGVYDVRLTVRGPQGSDTVTRVGAVTVRRCSPGNARANRGAPLERGEDFVPVTGDDSAGFYCVYSGKAVGPSNPGISNNVGIFVLPLAGDEVLVFGAGYGDANSLVTPTESAGHDARRVDALLRFCLGREPATTPLRFVAPHGHIDHINADFTREMRVRGYPIRDIAFHAADASQVRNLPGWTATDRALFRTLRNGTGQCQEELTSFASPLGRIWLHLRDGHTPGSIDLVIDVGGDPTNRFVVRGSGGDFGTCTIPGVREAIEPHGNVLLTARAPRVSGASPAHASALGGTMVTLSGSGFAAPLAGTPSVLVDGVMASGVSVLADDLLAFVVPPGLPGDVVDVTVTNRNGRAVLSGVLRYRALPTLSSLAPSRGPASGGTQVTLLGSGFLDFAPGTNTVRFGGVVASAPVVVDDRTLVCPAPPHAAGLVSVSLANANGSAELGGAYRYDPVIDVTGVAPAQGSARGGTRVELQGRAFAVGASVPQVFFGSRAATDVVRLGDTRIDCTTPPGPGGAAVDVRVSGDNGSDTLAAGFRYFAEPSVASVTPPSGPGAGGTLVTLTGSNFTRNAAGANTVSFGATAATEVSTLSDTSLQCRVPPGASGQGVDVVVENANGTGRLALGFRYHRAPTLEGLAPDQGPRAGGTLVTLRGSGFLEAGTGTPIVRFGGQAAGQVTVLDDGLVTCRTPWRTSEGGVDVELVTPNGSARLTSAFRYVTRPRVTGLTPASGSGRGGTLVTLTGTGFRAAGAGALEVRFGRAPATQVLVLDDRTATCRTPLGLGDAQVDVRVENQNGAHQLDQAFRYLASPGLASVVPPSGPLAGGQAVYLHGSGFAGGASPPRVWFGTAQATGVVVLADGELQCLTPPRARGVVDVRLETAGGSALLPRAYVYGSTLPTLDAVLPDHGPSAGGTLVELVGSNFASGQAGASVVSFGGIPATGVTVLDDERLRCHAPAGAPGSRVDVRVTNGNGSTLLVQGYRYHLRPTLTALEPGSGSALGGTQLLLHGSGFQGDGATGHAVRVGGQLASELQVLDDTRLTCRCPPGTPGTVVDVALATSNGNALLSAAFRYAVPPELHALTPATGSPLGGTPVTLSGAGFAGASTPEVRFAGVPATQVLVLGDGELTCLAPAGTPGVATDVELENTNGTGRLAAAFRYHPAPSIASATPASGPAGGGTTVLLLGSGFKSEVLGQNAVTFGGRPARSVTTVDDTRVRVVAPIGTPDTTVELVLANSNGSALAPGGFRYHALPVLDTCTPDHTSALGGATLTLRGSGFQRDGAGPPSVAFGGAPGGIVAVLDDQTLTCLAPPGSEGSAVAITLSNKNGSATAPAPLAYHLAPRLTSVTPAHGFSGGGTLVELGGSGFLAHEPGASTVRFGSGTASELTVLDDARLTCRTPPGATGPVEVRLENANGVTLLGDAYYYDWAPTLTAVAPAQGTALGGTRVTLSGGGFDTAGAGPLSVRFGSAPATGVSVLDGKTLECTTPAGPAGGQVDVTASNARGSARLTGYRYHPRPTLASVEPATGAPEGGTPVVLRGSGFLANGAGAPQVLFGATPATGVSVVDDATLTCVAPSGPARSSVSVAVANENGSTTLVDGYRWVQREPTDLDADGISDAIVAAANGVYVFFGSALGPTNESNATADLVLRHTQSSTDFGIELAAGDLNGDRFPDLVVAAPLDDASGSDAGAVYVFFGPLTASPSARLTSSASAVLRGASSGDRFGTALALGDVGGDALSDLIVGAPGSDLPGSDGGAVYVFRGAPTFASQGPAQAAVRLLATGSQHSFGASLAAGDVSGDGRADVLVGAPLEGASGGNSGAVYVFRGGPGLASGDAGAAQVRLTGASSGDRFGSCVGTADFDGDGLDELFAGAPEARHQGTQAGCIYVFRGGPGLASAGADDASARYDGEASGDRFGQGFALGDANGDGVADLLAGAPQHDLPSANAGRAYLVRGGAFLGGAIATRASTVLVAESSAGDQFGASLGLVDLDGDGRCEALVGAPFSNGGGTDSGRVYLFLGAALAATRSAGADDATLTGSSASLLFGRAVGSVR
ncbi:MAG TPA: IPT/TIG domain-containing protein [Planctomycetota bacterium]